ncbi:Homeobox-like_domain superfamily [Hexamita inflata]|uniref:Homeobox-like domain superfamily n=1 Tax=Hexamita inflata TaxID=28002 RepID=A0AA86TZJ5_9EUKA|nr:Homeobox-like domain superfamily [Hexamita inflata]CAI9968393.1 Homeobox-like domain superfamily [Hexamita inflata]
MGNRTPLQCKSYYQNIIKKTLDTTMRKNHVWTKQELMTLYTLGINFDCDFHIIHQNYLPNFTVQQLKSQWLQLKKKEQYFQQMYAEVLRNPQSVQNASDKQFILDEFLLRVGYAKEMMIEQHNNGLSNDKQLDVAELKVHRIFWNGLKPSQIIDVFQQELARRKLQTEYQNEYKNKDIRLDLWQVNGSK